MSATYNTARFELSDSSTAIKKCLSFGWLLFFVSMASLLFNDVWGDHEAR